jgi:hypothetical protein
MLQLTIANFSQKMVTVQGGMARVFAFIVAVRFRELFIFGCQG